jgi:hypothetical protein
VYEVVAFDDTNLKGQAMLTDCLATAMDDELIGEEHWWWTDEWLLYKLLESGGAAKGIAQRFIAGELYETVFLGWYDVSQAQPDLRHPTHRRELRLALEAELEIPVSPYVFYDNGTFAKTLELRVSGCATLWPEPPTPTSRSTIVGVFTPRADVTTRAHTRVQHVLRDFGLPQERLLPIPDESGAYGLAGQAQLPL